MIHEYSQAYDKSNGLVDPNEAFQTEDTADSSVTEWVDYLMTRTHHSWQNKLEFIRDLVGGIIMVIPLWVIFAIQS